MTTEEMIEELIYGIEANSQRVWSGIQTRITSQYDVDRRILDLLVRFIHIVSNQSGVKP